MTNQWRVSYGIHRGTLMSRHTADARFDIEQEAREFLQDVVNGYQPGRNRFGYVLWFASLWNPQDKRVEQINGYPPYSS